MLKKFTIQIWAYYHYAKFDVLAEDSAASIEQSILDKIGEKSIKWDSTGMFSETRRITYEELVDDTRPVQTQKILGVEVAVGV